MLRQNPPVLSGRQIAAARGLLGLTLRELATRAGLAYSTVQAAASAEGVPQIAASSLEKIETALINAGVQFLDEEPGGPGPGVRLRHPPRR
jgi:transcriptional regulator with XRE-family HTH domain